VLPWVVLALSAATCTISNNVTCLPVFGLPACEQKGAKSNPSYTLQT